MVNKTFCVLPWIHLATHPHGDVTLCCEADHTTRNSSSHNLVDGKRQFLNLHSNSIGEIINSDFFKQVRLQMLNGEQPQACQMCYQKEIKGLESKRTYENQNYDYFTQEIARELTKEDGTIDPNPIFVELRLGNTCNLMCRTCNPASSSKWRQQYKELENKLDFVRSYGHMTEFKWPEQKEFWDELFELSNNIVSLYINGGEPMLIKKHWEFLENLAKSGKAKNIHLWYSTNMSIIDDRSWDLWKEFGRVRILASIDDIGNRNHYIRYPTDWNKVIKFVDLLNEKSVEWIALQTISAMNFYYLDEFNDWVESKGTHVGHNYVSDPSFLGPLAIPLKARLAILDRFEKTLPTHLYENLRNWYGGDDHPELWKQFLTYTKELDKMRNENFEKTFHQFYQFLTELKVI